MSSRRRPWLPAPGTWLPALAVAAGVTLASTDASAAPNPKFHRRGIQWGVMLGMSACLPGKAECKRDDIAIDGKTRVSFGLGADLGYRIKPWVYVGAAYNFGLFNTDYEIEGASQYKRGGQHSVFGEVRFIAPVWRIDLGLGLAPGFSRQAFKFDNDDKDYSQGFAFKIGPVVDFYITRRVFLGAKADLILNAHGKTCRERGDDTSCTDANDTDLAPVHQVVFGLHLGGNFL